MSSTPNILESFRLDGRRALVTGSSGGIGFALARALAQAGASVILNGRNREKLEAAEATLRGEGLNATSCVFDVTDASDVKLAVDSLERWR
jgi:gluconate 5-dehydrogenase